jgi:hypothetical protein
MSEQQRLAELAEAKAKTLGDAFAKLRLLCEGEDYILEIPPRRECPTRSPRFSTSCLADAAGRPHTRTL